MQAIILAAGMGRRLERYTADNTKCMLSVCGKKLIDRVLEQLRDLGCVRRVTIVVGYKADNVMRHIADRYPTLDIRYIVNDIYDTTNNIYSLWLAREQLVADDTLLIESDLIFDPILLQRLIRHEEPNLALVDRYRPYMDGTMVRIDARGHIRSFIPKSAFREEDAATYYKTVNIYKFSATFLREKYIPFLNAYVQAFGRNTYYEQILRIITVVDHYSLQALPVAPARWYEIDDEDDLHAAEDMFRE